MTGKFIVFSGMDASGKSTNRDYVDAQLQRVGAKYSTDYILTREPGGTPFAERLRELILSKAYEIPSLTEALMFYAGRIDHTQNVIIPHLERGCHVLSDRYYDSTLAYQSIICEETFAIHNVCSKHLRAPDLTLVFDIPASVALERMQKSRGRAAMDKIESRGVEYFEQVRDNFLNMAKDDRNSVVIDANRPLEEVQAETWNRIKGIIYND